MEQLDGHRDLAVLLPEDLLANVLHRVVAPHSLAVSCCVCKAWRALVDSEGLLHTDLPFTGIFLSFDELPFPEFFSWPPSSCRPAISGNLDFLPPANKVHSINDRFCIQDHCNGLLLINLYAVHPAWLTLPHDAGILCHCHHARPTMPQVVMSFIITILPLIQGRHHIT
uniref:Uncharacterized protein n=1 Tax=Avena sativa TaxID=4498 RepID=A0ACD5VA97_AVESA